MASNVPGFETSRDRRSRCVDAFLCPPVTSQPDGPFLNVVATPCSRVDHIVIMDSLWCSTITYRRSTGSVGVADVHTLLRSPHYGRRRHIALRTYRKCPTGRHVRFSKAVALERLLLKLPPKMRGGPPVFVVGRRGLETVWAAALDPATLPAGDM